MTEHSDTLSWGSRNIYDDVSVFSGPRSLEVALRTSKVMTHIPRFVDTVFHGLDIVAVWNPHHVQNVPFRQRYPKLEVYYIELQYHIAQGNSLDSSG